MLSKVLPAEVNNGYHEFRDLRIVAVNGEPIRNLGELIQAVEQKAKAPDIRFESELGLKIVLDRQQVNSAQAAILRTYSVPADRSENLLQTAAGSRPLTAGNE